MGGFSVILFAGEVWGGGWGMGGGAGVAIPAGDLGRDLEEGPRMELLGGKEIHWGFSIRGGVRIYPLQGKREDLKVNLFSGGFSAYYNTSSSREKISFLLSAGLGWNSINRSFQTGKERGNGPSLSGEGGIRLPFNSSPGNLDLEGLLIFERLLSQKSGDLLSFGMRVWYSFNE